MPVSRPSVAVVIPWRPSPDRTGHLEACRAALLRALPEAHIMALDSGHDPFNRAASRNRAFTGRGVASIWVACDADAIVEPEPLRAAVEAAGDGKLHLPYTTCRLLTERGTKAVLAGADPSTVDAWYANTQSVGGCVVVSYETWRAVGGWDERFVGWGFEDTAFWAAADTLFGTVRHEGALHDLWHPDGREIGSPRYMTSKALCDRYTTAMGNRAAMRALIEERVCASA